MSNQMIQTRTFMVRLDEAGIVWVTALPGVTRQTEADARENLEALDQVRAGRKRPILADIREALSTDQAGRRLYSQTGLKDAVCAVALIVGSPVSRVIGSLYLGLNRPPFPMALFISEPEALAWLKGFLVEEGVYEPRNR